MTRQVVVDLSEEMAKQIDKAIAFSGQSEQEYIIEAIADKLEAFDAGVDVLELSDRDMDALLAAIENPPPPNEAMLRSIARWREHFSPM
jgi:uncharacterized protein (DUF1778 family)